MHRVVAECWLLQVVEGRLAAVDGDRGPASPTWQVEVPDGVPPVAALIESAPVPLTAAPPHSTSWRFAEGAVVISFVAVARELRPESLSVIPPYDPANGAKSAIHHERVLSHAARHVAFLLRTDPETFGLADPSRWIEATAGHVPTVFRSLGDGGGSC